jgi:hypothetical protein
MEEIEKEIQRIKEIYSSKYLILSFLDEFKIDLNFQVN